MASTDTLGFIEPYVWDHTSDLGRNITLKEFIDKCLAFNSYIVKYKIKLLAQLSNYWMPSEINEWWYEGFVFFENLHYNYTGIGKIIFYHVGGIMYLGSIYNNVDTKDLSIEWYKQLFQKV